MTPLVDSHCHLDFPEFSGQLESLLTAMQDANVGWGLCAGVKLEDFDAMIDLLRSDKRLFAAVGVHPDVVNPRSEASVQKLCELADESKVVAIGETGLDYHRHGQCEWQKERFRVHIRAARLCGKPLIIHTRAAAADTISILIEEDAAQVGGVFHCFTQELDVAIKALELGFYISFSGIVTFKNAASLRKVAQAVPLERLLVETDAPFLAPVPFRGKLNQPAYVSYVAEKIASLRNLSLAAVAAATTENFFRLFADASR